MKKFTHVNASSIDEAVSWLGRYGQKASVIAGGTDLLGKLKDEILPTYPEAVINIKTIPGLDSMREEEGMLKIGALTKLHDIAVNPEVKERYPALSDAAHRTASPNIRQMGSVGGNICQDIRCWYYRNSYNRFPCLRKGGGRCYAIEGDNRYHSIFGGSVEGGCYAVHPSDTAPVFIALGAKIMTSKRIVNAEDFFDVVVGGTTILDEDEIVTEIQVPAPTDDQRSAFMKFALRSSIDFPIVNCAVMINESNGVVSAARICLNAVFVKPYRAHKAEEAILGKAIDESNAEAAGEAAVSGAKPLMYNRYMIPIAKALVKRAILACKNRGS
ncbi:MAG: FAD binding domain-containing protein [Desulfobacteraceae bacterium]|nr:FAD binding domain-containing protein [Desulfobacteraceae bacterium]